MAAADIVVAGAAAHPVVAGAAVKRVVAVAAEDAVPAGAAAQQVVARPGIDAVAAIAAPEPVAAIAARERVMAVAAEQGVVAGQTADVVVAGQPVDVVIARGAHQHVVARGRHRPACGQQEVARIQAGQAHPLEGQPAAQPAVDHHVGADLAHVAGGEIGIAGDRAVATQVDPVEGVEIGDPVDPGAHHEEIGARAPGQRIVARAPVQRVGPGGAGQAVLPAARADVVVGGIAGDRVVAGPGKGVLDHRAPRDGDISGQPVHVRIGLGVQVDALVGGVPGGVDPVDAALVEDRVGHRPAGIGARGRVQEIGEIAAQVGAGAPDRGARRGAAGPGRAIEVLDGHDIGHHRAHHRGPGRVDCRVVGLAEIGHDRDLPAVIGKGLVHPVCGRAVIAALVAQPQGMADLVDIGLEGIAVERGAVAGQPALADHHVGRDDFAGEGDVAGGIGTVVILIADAGIVEGDVGAGGRGFHEGEIGDHLPGFQRPAGQLLARGGQPGQVHRDLVRSRQVESPARAAVVLPVAVGQVIG